ncbi:ATP-binding protein [Actinacidiphila oryziradicis]|uniref:ATP-binding protein n=1 Tax=Actinacidiphila oryziradicis TaxID=2571141 RepID=A0A4U0RTE1_9ACTN|nr:ATP-binding protein [Actinacidiphila oryziradicis]TJZ99375.1 ATP-binding protein [Actinacidiphila oryziradicis]
MTQQVGRTFQFAISDQAPQRARRAVRNAVLAWEYGEELADVAELLTSEVITNATQHAAGTAECVVRVRVNDGLLTVGVYDCAGGAPRVKHPASDAECGRGLGIVAALVADWGIRPDGGGKEVFFALRVPPIPRRVYERELAGTAGER